MTQAPTADLDGPEEAPEQAPEPEEDVEVRDAELADVESGPLTDDDRGGTSGLGQIDILLDTSVEIAARLGETHLAVRELLELRPGSVLKLDRAAGDPVDLYLNGIRFATGHLVVVEDRLGIRIKEILKSDPDALAAELA